MARWSRRALLAGGTAGLANLAGCGVLRSLLGGADGAGEPSASTSTTTPHSMVARDNGYPRRVAVTNTGDDERFVTVVVARDDEVVYSQTRPVPARETVTFEDVAWATGEYRIQVETTDGLQATRAWPISPALGDLSVLLEGDGMDFRQEAYCTPACEPLSRGGSAATLPYYGSADDNPLYYGATFALENRSGGHRDVRLQVHRDERTILDYRYDVPRGMALGFPGVHVADVYDVTVTTDQGSTVHAWHITKERYLTVTLEADDVRIGCGGSTASLRLVNDQLVAHEVTLRARSVGSSPDDADAVHFQDRYQVPSGTTMEQAAVFAGSGQYLLDVALASGQETTYDWWLCPPRGPTEVRIGENGRLSVIQIVPPE